MGGQLKVNVLSGSRKDSSTDCRKLTSHGFTLKQQCKGSRMAALFPVRSWDVITS